MSQTEVVENIKTRFMFNDFFPENRAVCEIMWKTTVDPDRRWMAIWRMRIACWMTKASDTLSVSSTFCFSTVTMIVRMRLIVTFIRTLPVLISVFNQLDGQSLFHNKFYFMPLHVSNTCARNM